MGKQKPKAKDTGTLPVATNIHQRGAEWEAVRLTGKRSQKGIKYLYQVEWKSKAKTFEPVTCLVGWEAEMKKVDEEIEKSANEPFLNQVAVIAKKRELDAIALRTKLEAHRQQLRLSGERQQRKEKRQRRLETGAEALSEAEDESGGESDDLVDDDDAGIRMQAELLVLEGLMRPAAAVAAAAANGGTTAGATVADTTPGTPTGPTNVVAPAQVRASPTSKGRSRVWLAIDKVSNTCMLPCPNDKTQMCCRTPPKGGGTSGQVAHLKQWHPKEWAHIQETGQVKTSVQMIEDALKAKTDQSMPALPINDRDELHRLVAVWIAKCGRAQKITEDKQLHTLVARILELCKAKLRYVLPCAKTVSSHLLLLGPSSTLT